MHMYLQISHKTQNDFSVLCKFKHCIPSVMSNQLGKFSNSVWFSIFSLRESFTRRASEIHLWFSFWCFIEKPSFFHSFIHENYWLFPFYSNNLAFILHSFSYEYFTLGIYMCILSSSVGFDSLSPHGLYPTRLLCPWNFLGKNTGMGCYFFLQGIFPTQELNQCLLYQTRLSNWARP